MIAVWVWGRHRLSLLAYRRRSWRCGTLLTCADDSTTGAGHTMARRPAARACRAAYHRPLAAAPRPDTSAPIPVRSPTVVLSRLLRAGEHKTVRRLRAIADHINSLEGDVATRSDADLRAKTDEFRHRYGGGGGSGAESLDDLLPEAFAVVREARQAHHRPAALRRPADGRCRAAPGQHRRDEHRRGQDAGLHAAGVPQRASQARACTSSRSTTTSPSVTRSGWAGSTGSSGLSVGADPVRT